jgi:hypothetical protein
MSHGTERLNSIPSEKVHVKPLYLKFVDVRDAGELPEGMTWAKYQELFG